MYSPKINPGTPPLKTDGFVAPTFSMYSNKNIVQSSQPVRDDVMSVQIKAGELEQKLNDFKVQMAKSPFNKMLMQ